MDPKAFRIEVVRVEGATSSDGEGESDDENESSNRSGLRLIVRRTGQLKGSHPRPIRLRAVVTAASVANNSASKEKEREGKGKEKEKEQAEELFLTSALSATGRPAHLLVCSYMPDEAGEYHVEASYAGELLSQSPIKVIVSEGSPASSLLLLPFISFSRDVM